MENTRQVESTRRLGRGAINTRGATFNIWEKISIFLITQRASEWKVADLEVNIKSLIAFI